MNKIAVIPARYDSVRFPGKPLATLYGKPIIQHVYQKVINTELFDDVIVATDDQRIFDAIIQFDGKVMLTSKKHQSGTDRVAEICEKIKCDIVVNVQGDEPFISKKPLEELIFSFNDKKVEVASLMHKINSDLENPNYVKVVCDINNFALYFSRSVIPFIRDHKSRYSAFDYYKHIGVYAFRKDTLLKFVALPQSRLEKIEKLEQLRMLQNGIRIKMVETEYTGIGIDTPEDLKKAEKIKVPR
jgi:3-deoxy-manno-octulosonate cytidylyltransferase (CMP-KDO synthetase)